MVPKAARVEWPTLIAMIGTYAIWAIATTIGYGWSPVLAILITGIMIAQFSSLQHEVLHDHPFQSRQLNEILVFPALTLTVPFGRFRDVHLAHHYDPNLTDPYDDPESNYLDPAVWTGLSRPMQVVLRANNTLAGRIVLGPLITAYTWLRSEALLVLQGDASVRWSWGLHIPGVVVVIAWIWVAAMPWWAYLLATWIGHGLLRIRTFLEHRAHELARGRSVIVEDRGPLALLFLNNNYHAVHHMHPGVAWYELPALYAQNLSHYRRRNEGYIYASYWQIFRQHLWVAKDPVSHPIYPVNKTSCQAVETGTGAGVVKEGHAVLPVPVA